MALRRAQQREDVTFFVADNLAHRWAAFPERYKAAYAEKALRLFDQAPRYPTAIAGGKRAAVELTAESRTILARLVLAYGEAASTVLSSAIADMLNANPEAKTLNEFVGYGR